MLLKRYSINAVVLFASFSLIAAFCHTSAAQSTGKRSMSLQEMLSSRLGKPFDDGVKNKVGRAQNQYEYQIRELNSKLCYTTSKIYSVENGRLVKEMLAEKSLAVRMWGLLGMINIILREDIDRGVSNSIKRRTTSQETERFEAAWKTYQDSTLACQETIFSNIQQITGMPDRDVAEILAQYYHW
jgi:hypothetical protein